jgi:lipopolysaccharide transport system ATP-binding protein
MNSLGQAVTRFDSEVSAPVDVREPGAGTTIECEVDLLSLMPGRYRIDARVNQGSEVQDGLDGAAYFDVEPGIIEGRPVHTISGDGDVILPHSWRLPS